MIKNKGQALIEFVIILPILLLILLAMIDIGKILYFKNSMEGTMNTIVSMYDENKDFEEINDYIKEVDKQYELSIEENDYVNFKLIKTNETIAPGLDKIFGDTIEVTRVKNHE